MKSQFFTNAAQLLCFGISVCVFIIVYLYVLAGKVETDQDVFRVDILCGAVCGIFLCIGLGFVRQLTTHSIKNIMKWGEILLASFVTGVLCFGVIFVLMSMGLGLVILIPVLGWLSTIQEGTVLIAALAGLGCYLSILAGIALVFPFLFSVNSENISSYELE